MEKWWKNMLLECSTVVIPIVNTIQNKQWHEMKKKKSINWWINRHTHTLLFTARILFSHETTKVNNWCEINTVMWPVRKTVIHLILNSTKRRYSGAELNKYICTLHTLMKEWLEWKATLTWKYREMFWYLLNITNRSSSNDEDTTEEKKKNKE